MLRLKRAENVRGRANERDPRAEQDGVQFQFLHHRGRGGGILVVVVVFSLVVHFEKYSIKNDSSNAETKFVFFASS